MSLKPLECLGKMESSWYGKRGYCPSRFWKESRGKKAHPILQNESSKLHNTCKKLVRSWCYLQKKLNVTLVKQNIKCTLKSLK
jgi:hypothetical protein